MDIQALIVTTEDGDEEIFLGLPIIDIENPKSDIEDIAFTNTFYVPEDATIQEAITLLYEEIVTKMSATEGDIVH